MACETSFKPASAAWVITIPDNLDDIVSDGEVACRKIATLKLSSPHSSSLLFAILTRNVTQVKLLHKTLHFYVYLKSE